MTDIPRCEKTCDKCEFAIRITTDRIQCRFLPPPWHMVDAIGGCASWVDHNIEIENDKRRSRLVREAFDEEYTIPVVEMLYEFKSNDGGQMFVDTSVAGVMLDYLFEYIPLDIDIGDFEKFCAMTYHRFNITPTVRSRFNSIRNRITNKEIK